MQDAVSAAPGGPSHVLLSDVVAEHIPGCNMAFHRAAFESIQEFRRVKTENFAAPETSDGLALVGTAECVGGVE